MARCLRASGFFFYYRSRIMLPELRLTFVSSRRLTIVAVLFISLLATQNGWADDKDTSLRLNQSIDLQSNEQERQILKDEDYLKGERPTLTIDGKTYTIKHDVNDVGRALYMSIQQKQWPAVIYFLDEYQTFANADPMLIAYAQGSLARLQGNMQQAEAEFKTLLDIKPDFMLGQLELARVLFENRKDAESEAMFQQIAQSLNPADARQQGVLTTVDSFLQAVDKRQAWQGSIALGPTWSDNLNQTSESYSCLFFYGSVCLFERATPEAVKSHGVDYELTLNKRFALSGHHGLFFRSLWFGQSYKDHSIYNESQLSTQFGYSYHDMRNQYSLAPSFEFVRYGNDSLYGAAGLHGEWLHYLTDKVMFKLEADYKDQQYRKDILADQYDGGIWSSYATAWYGLPNNWTLFGGLDWTRKTAEVEQNAYEQIGVRAGVAKNFNEHINAVLFVSLREREHDAFNALLDEQRKDFEQNYTVILRFPTLAVYGLEPNLTFKHRKVQSNVDWLYSYDSNSVSLKLEKRF
ncbi:porin family protein [Methylophaga muralis]|uniref:TPR repeat-containing protein n=1 Tax=Methylophaga muralis TaxID=291169 RepID=A0A1E3GPX8_9GAMM|nr:porin family protein [Methylophaga muralis]ODN66113.1 TPR repeat-containing protein precursor [Methylophaga muralis]